MGLLAALLSRQPGGGPTGLVRAMLDRGPFPGGPSEVVSYEGTAFGARGPVQSTGADGLWSDDDVAVVVDGRLDWSRVEWISASDKHQCSTPELVARAYRRDGRAFVAQLYGDFALVLLDKRTGDVLAARDTFGLRPLYYADSPAGLAFASDPEQLLSLPFVSREFDPDSIIDYLLWDPRTTDRSFFRSIRAVPGGHVLTASSGRVTVLRYPTNALRFARESSRDAYYRGFRTAFEGAVRRSLAADGPVVAELSGGLDSSSIICVANSLVQAGVVVASARYPGLPTDEGEYINAVAETISFPVRTWDGTAGTLDELQEDTSLALPGGRFATFAGTEGQLEIMREVGARVLISGLGGDQIGSSSGAIRDAVTELRWRDAARMARRWPTRDRLAAAKIMYALARSFVPVWMKRLRRRRRKSVSWLTSWAQARPCPPPLDVPELGSEIRRRNWRALSSGLHAMTMTYVHHYAVRNGIEFRFPFLELEVVARAFAIPSRYWPPPWPFERLHRQILADVLPEKVRNRRGKATFDAALQMRVRRHLPTIRELVLGSEWASAQFVQKDQARALLRFFEQADSPGLDATYGLWAIVTVEAWMRRVFRYALSPTRGQR